MVRYIADFFREDKYKKELRLVKRDLRATKDQRLIDLAKELSSVSQDSQRRKKRENT